MYIGGIVKLTVEDRFGITHDPTEQASLSNTAVFDLFQNTASLTALVDLNKILLTTSYDHFTASALSGTYSFVNRNADSIRVSAAWLKDKATVLGLDGAVTYSYYPENFQNDSTSVILGPFWEQTVSRYMTVRMSGGIQTMAFARGGLNKDNSDLTGWYAGLEVAHRINRFCTETLSVGHESSLGLESNYETSNYVRYTASLRLINRVTATVNAFYEQVEESGGIFGQSIDRFGAGVAFGYQVNRHLSLNLGYQFINKTSDLPGYDYSQNRVSLGAWYRF